MFYLIVSDMVCGSKMILTFLKECEVVSDFEFSGSVSDSFRLEKGQDIIIFTSSASGRGYRIGTVCACVHVCVCVSVCVCVHSRD